MKTFAYISKHIFERQHTMAILTQDISKYYVYVSVSVCVCLEQNTSIHKINIGIHIDSSLSLNMYLRTCYCCCYVAAARWFGDDGVLECVVMCGICTDNNILA